MIRLTIILLFIIVSLPAFSQEPTGHKRPCNTDTTVIDYTISCEPVCDSSYRDTGIVVIDRNCWRVNYRSLKDGTYKTYKRSDSGKLYLFEIVTYKLNRATDRWLKYHENGVLEQYTSYESGVPEGIALYYNESSVLCNIYFINMYNEHGVSGTFTTYWETGELASVKLIHKHVIISTAYFDKEGRSISKAEFDNKWNDCSY